MKNCSMWLLLSCLLLLVGCERRPLVEPSDSSAIKVRVLTKGITNVTKDIYNEKIPAPTISTDILRVLFYDKSGERLLSEGFISDKEKDSEGNEVISGRVSLSPGAYRVMTYNFDTPSTLVRDLEKWHTATAYTSPISVALHEQLSNRGEQKNPIYYEPDHFLVGRNAELMVDMHEETKVIELNTETIVDTYYIQIRVKNIEQAATARAVLTGLSSSVRFGDNVRDDETSSAIFIELVKSVDERIEEENKDVICAVFNTFGRIEDAPSNLHITFNVVTRAGETVEKEIDMTPVFATEDARKRHWLLIEEVWELPEPEKPNASGGGGFNPEVNDWGEVEETIPIV